MIEELRIRDLGVISDATLPLGPGLSVVSGETGAGKTMVVTAVGLLLGATGRRRRRAQWREKCLRRGRADARRRARRRRAGP